MDKAKTLEVLRGMKFMQRKEEAKRRATFEVAQREEIERHLHSTDGSTTAASAAHRGRTGPARATVLYDDAVPTGFYGLSRRSFTDALAGEGQLSALVEEGQNSHADGADAIAAALEEKVNELTTSKAHHGSAANSEDEEVEDLWGGEDGFDDSDLDDETTADPTAAPGRRAARAKLSKQPPQHKNHVEKGGRTDGRFTVQSAVRAPKLPRRLEERVAADEQERKRRRAEEERDDMGFM